MHNLDFSLVEKPSRYIGGEVNSVVKENAAVRFAFAFPDVYEVGMSYVGLHLLYQMLNELDYLACERVFMPWVDMISQMEEKEIPLYTYETMTPIGECDFLGFTLQYELSFTNIVKMLSLSGIPVFSSARDASNPIVIAGGPCAVNPEPLADIVDLFCIGEGEEVMVELFELSRQFNLRDNAQRDTFFAHAAQLEGVYVPRLYRPIYVADRLTGYEDLNGNPMKPIRKRVAPPYRYTKQIVPFTEIVHDRVSMELFRGCTRGCRFCQAGMIYRPVRENTRESAVEQAKELIANTGYDELSLSSLSTLDYSEIEELIDDLLVAFDGTGVSLSLPSLRMDSASVGVLQEIQKVRKTGLTFAPEAGTQRMRNVINKGVYEENIIHTFEQIFSMGWFRVKLYFMIGLPTETDEDVEGIIKLARSATWIYKRVKPKDVKKSVEVTASASCFVPKPFTPFQWHPQCSIEEFEHKISVLKAANPNRKINLNYHSPKESWLEGIFARGDRKLARVINRAVELGCYFDGWADQFKFDLWMRAFDDCGIDPKYYNERKRSMDEFFPWDIIDTGISKAFLQREYEKALRSEETHDCREGCVVCGIGCMTEEGLSRFSFSDGISIPRPPAKETSKFELGGQNAAL